MAERQFTDAELEAALSALSEPGRFRAAEQRVAQMAPQLQRILGEALREGGWFDAAHESQLTQAVIEPDQDERINGVRRLLAEETRMGMLVGVAVGWELGRELDRKQKREGEN